MTFLFWLKSVTVRVKSAAAWVKAHWQWIVLPVGILLWLAGRASKKPEVVLSSPLGDHETVKEQLEREGIQKLREADAKRKQDLAKIDAQNNAALEEIRVAAKAKAAEMQQAKPEQVTDFLKQVGKDVRKG